MVQEWPRVAEVMVEPQLLQNQLPVGRETSDMTQDEKLVDACNYYSIIQSRRAVKLFLRSKKVFEAIKKNQSCYQFQAPPYKKVPNPLPPPKKYLVPNTFVKDYLPPGKRVHSQTKELLKH
jgi:hypothetical protein